MKITNNDLIDKKYSDAFKYYATFENQKWNSVHAWDLGYVHWVCLNSNTDYTYVTDDGSIGGYASTDAFLQAQADWLDQHLTEVEQRSTKPRWVICYMHLSPFTVVRTKRVQRFVSVFEKHKVDAVLCGHNHCYSRSLSLKTGYDFSKSPAYNDYVTKVSEGSTELKLVDEFQGDGETEINRTENLAEGVLYVMNQAGGYKLTGKEGPINLTGTAAANTKHANSSNQPWWYVKGSTPTQPTYIMGEITKDHIKLNMYQLGVLDRDSDGNTSVLTYPELVKKNVQKELFDTVTINYSDRNKK